MNDIINKIELLNPQPKETIVLTFDADNVNCNIDDVCNICKVLMDKYPLNNVIALPSQSTLKCFTKEVLE